MKKGEGNYAACMDGVRELKEGATPDTEERGGRGLKERYRIALFFEALKSRCSWTSFYPRKLRP